MKQLDPRAVWLFFFSYVSRWLLPIIFIIIYAALSVEEVNVDLDSVEVGSLSWLWIGLVIFLVLCFIWAKLTYKFYRYELTDAGFRKESGVIIKRYVTIPYDRIQNIDIHRGILARLLGLSDLQVQTAGASAVVSRYGMSGMGAEGRLPGLSMQVAEQMRDEVVQKARQYKNQGL